MDGINLNESTGEAVFTFEHAENGSEYQITLKRPKLKDYRNLVEALGNTAADLADVSDGEAADKISSGAFGKQLDRFLDWLRTVFSTLGSAPLPDEDDLPAWLLSGSLVQDLIQHWQLRPTRPGGQ